MAFDTFKSDTGESFGLDQPEANRRRLRELMDCDPRLLVEDDRHQLYHCPGASPSCFFRLEVGHKTISYYTPYEMIELPFVGTSVTACSWASLMHGIGTASKDRVFFEELPKIANMIASQPGLPREGICYWLDLQGHAHRCGYMVGLVHEDGRIVEHEPDALRLNWVEDFSLIQESMTIGDLRFLFGRPKVRY